MEFEGVVWDNICFYGSFGYNLYLMVALNHIGGWFEKFDKFGIGCLKSWAIRWFPEVFEVWGSFVYGIGYVGSSFIMWY